MTNRIPLIVNAGAAQIQEVSASDVLTVPGTVSANVVQTDNYQYANGQPFAGGGGNYGNANVAAYLPTYTGDLSANNVTVGTVYSPNFYGNAVTYTNATGYLTTTNLFKYNPGTEILTVGGASLTGNITANYFIGNGSQLTGISGGANTGNVTFDNINIIGTGNLHLQPDPANTGSYLDIFLTSGPDLHLVASASANLILGKDNDANIMTSWNGNVYVQSWNQDTGNVGGVWTFGGDGGTIFPTLTVQRGDNPSGTIQGQTLLFGDAAQEAVISTPDGNPTDGINSQRLVINPGQGYGSGEGGDIYLWAGRGGPTDGSGGDVKIRGGQGMADGTGGYIRIEGGDTQGAGYPGYIDIKGGQGGTTQGAYVRITGGQGATNGGEAGVIGGYGTDVGGDANITAGYGGTNQGGNVNITGGGSALGLSGYGNVNVNAGASQWVFNNTGVLAAPGAISAVGNIIGGNITTGGIANLNSVRMSQSISWPDYSGSEIYEDGGLVINGPGGVYATGNIAARFEFNDGAGNSSGLYSDIGNSLVYSVGNVIVRSNNLSQTDWTFDTTGNLNLPQGGWIGAAGVKGDGTMLTGGLGQIASLTSFYADAPGVYSSCVTVNPNGTLNITTYGNGTGVLGQWVFSGANLTVPGNSVVSTPNAESGLGGNSISIAAGAADQFNFNAYAGGNLNLTGGLGGFNDDGVGGPGGNVNISAGLPGEAGGHAGNVTVNAGTNTWTFEYTGNVIVPGNLNYEGVASPAPSINGFDSVNVITVNATGNISATGNVTAGNVYANNIVAEAPFIVIATNFEANIGGRYGVDTTGGTVTATLSNTPPTGGAVFFADAGGAYSSNNLIIDPNGGTIMGSTGNMTVSTNNQSVGLFYNGATWRIYNAG